MMGISVPNDLQFHKHRFMHENLKIITICNSPKVETILMTIDSRMDKKAMVNSQNGAREWTFSNLSNNASENYASQNKIKQQNPDMKEHSLCDYSYVKETKIIYFRS